MKYEATDALSRDAAEALAVAGDVPGLSTALIALSLADPDLAWTTAFLLRFTTHASPNVRGNALLGFGHLARRFRSLPGPALVRAAIAAGLADADAFVRGQAESASDDLASFLPAHER